MAKNTDHHNQNNIRDLLSPYLDGEVTAAERLLVEQALAASPELQQDLDSLRQTVDLVTALPTVAAPRPFTLTAADVEAISPSTKSKGFRVPAWLGGLAMTAVALFCILAAGGVFYNASKNQTARIQPAGEIAQSAAETTSTANAANAVEEKVVAVEETAVEESQTEAIAAAEKEEPQADLEPPAVEAIEEGEEAPAEEAMEEAESMDESADEAAMSAMDGEMEEMEEREEDLADSGAAVGSSDTSTESDQDEEALDIQDDDQSEIVPLATLSPTQPPPPTTSPTPALTPTPQPQATQAPLQTSSALPPSDVQPLATQPLPQADAPASEQSGPSASESQDSNAVGIDGGEGQGLGEDLADTGLSDSPPLEEPVQPAPEEEFSEQNDEDNARAFEATVEASSESMLTLARQIIMQEQQLQVQPGLIQIEGIIEAEAGTVLVATLQRNQVEFGSWAKPDTLQSVVQDGGHFIFNIQAAEDRLDQNLLTQEAARYQIIIRLPDAESTVISTLFFESTAPRETVTTEATSSSTPLATNTRSVQPTATEPQMLDTADQTVELEAPSVADERQSTSSLIWGVAGVMIMVVLFIVAIFVWTKTSKS